MEESTEPKEFDIIRGGDLSLPSDVSVLQYAAARAEEIASLTAAIENPNKTALMFQKLPRHLRRRAMSHVPNRMPRKVREAHKAQMAKSGVSKTNKRPSRKYRRRPRNLLEEYNRRQRENAWLETHIWHAKRFHMIEKWGYKLPLHPNDRSFRACYRAVAKHCLLQDVSYLCCLELRGTETSLKQGFQHISSPESNLFAAEYTNGHLEGKMTIYSRDSYPYEALGDVSYFWKPGDASTRVLWLWVHPASYEEILLEIKTTFDLTVLQSIASNEVNGPGCTDKVTAKKLAVKNLERTPQWHSSSTPIELTVLKGTLNRFRLIGPLATPILHHVLQPACIETSSTTPEKDEPVAKKPKITKEVTNEPQCWWQDFYQHTAEQKDHRICHQLQKDVWSALALPSNNPKPHSIVPLTVRDPRLLLPPKRTKAFRAPEQEVEDKEDEMDGKTALESDENMVEDNSALKILEVDSRALVSPFWDVTLRNAASIQRLSDHEINQIRSKLLVPGTNLNLGERESRIPVLLIRAPNPNPDVGEFGLGWDLIVPAGWGMAFWMNLVYRGGRVGGLKELRGFYYESGVLDPNLSLPDTRASPREQTLEKQKLMEEYFKKPPKNRVNFIKLGTVCPFIPHWNQLIQDWYSTLGNWNVLRKACKQLDDLRQVWSSNSAAETLSRLERTFASQKCLVAVQVVCLGKGKPDHNCSISLPTDEDLQKLETNPSFVGPVEEAHADPNAKLRKKMRQEHEKEVKKLRRQRVQAKQSGDADQLQGAQSKSQTACEQFNATTRDLWLPDESQAIRTSSTRHIIGFCSHADYSFRKARGCGNGLVVAAGLLELMKQTLVNGHSTTSTSESRLVLLRNPCSSQYMFASLRVL